MSNELGLPERSYKKWKVTEKRKVNKNFKPLNPNFCPVIDPDTGKKCNKFMRKWDLMMFETYGMCEDCFRKYNPQIPKEKIDAVTNETEESN